MLRFFLALTMASVFNYSTAHAILIDKIVAGVNSDVILQSDLDRFQRTIGLRKELDPLFGLSAEMTSDKPTREKSLDFLIQERLITQTFKVTETEIDQEIQSVMKNNNLEKEQLITFLDSKNYSYPDYQDLIGVGLAKRNLLNSEIRTRVNVSDDDVRNDMVNKLKDSSAPIEYHLQVITIDSQKFKTLAFAQEAAEGALRSIRQGEAFTEVAKRVSDDASAEQGGDLGFVPSENLASGLLNAVKNLQVGAVSELIKTATGYKIVKLRDARSTETQKFQEMKEQIREKIAKEEYKKQLVIWADRARNGAYIHAN